MSINNIEENKMYTYKFVTATFLLYALSKDEIHLSLIDTSFITSFNGFFTQIDRKDFNGIEHWNMSNVEDISRMFDHVEHFNHDISNWDVSNIIYMKDTFRNTKLDYSLDIWKPSKVENTFNMFLNTPLEKSNRLPKWYKE